MDEILTTIDKAIKRLVAPTAMVVAAALLSKGLNQSDRDLIAIKMYLWLLIGSSFLFMLGSTISALNEFEKAGIGIIRRSVLSLSFVLVYLVLFFAGMAIALGKLHA